MAADKNSRGCCKTVEKGARQGCEEYFEIVLLGHFKRQMNPDSHKAQKDFRFEPNFQKTYSFILGQLCDTVLYVKTVISNLDISLQLMNSNCNCESTKAWPVL